MNWPGPLLEGHLIRRYKRFLADVELLDGRQVVAHCPNTGSMQGCALPGSRVWLSVSNDPRRKLPFTWELAQTPAGDWIGINTARPNGVVREAIAAGHIPALSGYGQIRSEVRYGQENSRIDLHLSGHLAGLPDVWVEVKNVTLAESDGWGLFPDAVSTRGQKHLRELRAQCLLGDRAVLLFCVSHSAIHRVAPAALIDPVYAQLLRDVAGQGVEVMAWKSVLTPQTWTLDRAVPVILDQTR